MNVIYYRYVVIKYKLNPGSSNWTFFGSFSSFLNPAPLQFGFFFAMSILTDKGLTGAWDLWEALQLKL